MKYEPHQTCNQHLLKLCLRLQPPWHPFRSNWHHTLVDVKISHDQNNIWFHKFSELTIHKTYFLDSRLIHHAGSWQFHKVPFWDVWVFSEFLQMTSNCPSNGKWKKVVSAANAMNASSSCTRLNDECMPGHRGCVIIIVSFLWINGKSLSFNFIGSLLWINSLLVVTISGIFACGFS